MPLLLEALGEVRGDESPGTGHADAEVLALKVRQERVLGELGRVVGVGHLVFANLEQGGCLLSQRHERRVLEKRKKKRKGRKRTREAEGRFSLGKK